MMKYIESAHEFVFEEDRPFKSCHASTLLLLPDKSVLAAWFGGTAEGANDVGIWMAKRVQGQWTSPEKVSVQKDIPHWNPVLSQSPDGTIFLFYKVGYRIPQWVTMVRTSQDGGQTWTLPRELVQGDIGGRGPVKNKAIVLEDGTWIAPASVEGEYWNAFVDISYDGGSTWIRSELVPLQRSVPGIDTNAVFHGKGVIQPTLWESKPGVVHMLLRSTEGCIYRSDSQDGGRTWSTAFPTCLPNNNSGIDVTRLENGVLALVYNPVAQNWGPRSPLVASLSYDNGETWSDEYVLEEKGEGCEYSYPAIISKGKEIFITYTWNRQRIVFWNLALDFEG